ncbi:MAG: hypothetical protein GY940_23090, partial [bacterium]|nr:hypothetical protein [bacterium]
MATRIENSYGHVILIEYQTGSNPALKKITDSMNRTIDFVLSNNRLDYISVDSATGGTVKYEYTVGTYPYSGYYRLQTYDPPEIPASTYEYYNGQYDRYELTAINNSHGGRVEYDFANFTFHVRNQAVETRVLTEKRIRFNTGESFKTWNYLYPSYLNVDTGTVTVDGPLYDTYVTYHALTNDTYESGWKIGLMKKKWFSDNSYSQDHEWEYRQISSNVWLVLNSNLGPIRAPLQQSIAVTRQGDCESKQEFLYQRGDVKDYGLPTRVNVYGGTSGTSLKHYKTLQYYFETNSTYRSRHLIAYIKNEAFYSSGNSKLKETKTDYYTGTGKYGAIDKIQRWRSGG